MPRTLSITWDMKDRWPQPNRWHQWEAKERSPHALEKRLGWPEGTLSFLQEGFQNNLSRSVGWDASKLGDQQKACLTASRFFKRGVASRPDKESVGATRGIYPIEVFADAHLTFLTHSTYSSCFVVIDENVAKAWPALRNMPDSITCPVHETSKNLELVAQLISRARSLKPDAPWLIIGGGVLADVASFAASVLDRSFTLVPTTLLAMVDACVGGKTGVNFPPYGKNQVGTFSFPEKVLVCPDFLRTLPARDLQSGIAECVKHALLVGDEGLLQKLCQLGGSWPFEAEISQCIQVKAHVVAQDPLEKGVRATLNLGHTLGHALEAVSHEHVKPENILFHGEAVGVGLWFALELSQSVGYLAVEEKERLHQSLKQAGSLQPRHQLERHLGFSLSDPRLWQHLVKHMKQDKKVSGPYIEWVLLEKAGKVAQVKPDTWTCPVPEKTVEDVWQNLVTRY